MINPENLDVSTEVNSEEDMAAEPVHTEKKKSKSRKKHVSVPDPPLTILDQLASPQEKLQKVIELMEASLAQSGIPNFKLFWDARKICLDFFKDPTLANIKTIYWPKCHELTKEALRLKTVL